MSNSTTAGLFGEDMPSFLRNCKTIFQSGCAILHSHQQRMRNRFSASLPEFIGITIFSVLAGITDV